MATGSLILKGAANSRGKQKVYIKFSHKGIPKLVLTNERISPEELDPLYVEAGKLQVKADLKFSAKINKRVNRLYDLIDEVLDDFIEKKPNSFTASDLKESCIKKAWWKDDIREFTTWKEDFEAWILHRKEKEAAAENTLRMYRACQNRFERYLKTLGAGNASILDITPDIVNDWIKVLLSEGCDPFYVKSNIIVLRKVCVFYNNPQITAAWKPNRKLSYIKKQAVAFTVEEIKQLYNYQPQDEHLQRVKDLLFRFIASGVRWSDQDLDVLNRHGNFILKRSKKNSGLSTIPMSKYLLEVLEKPKPVMSHGHFNEYVKKLCELAGIDTPVIKESAKGGVISHKMVPKWTRVSSKIGRKSLTSLLTAAGFTLTELRQVLGNSVELEAYQVPDMDTMAKKIDENMDGALGS